MIVVGWPPLRSKPQILALPVFLGSWDGQIKGTHVYMAMQPTTRWLGPWPDDLSRPEHGLARWPPSLGHTAQGTRPCMGRHLGTRHGTGARPIPTVGLMKINCWCSCDLYICDVNCYTGENNE